MSGRAILTASAIVLFAIGAVAMFAADEAARWFDEPESAGSSIAIQVLGSAFLGFAILNWMSRGNRIGGIYARPLALGNFLLFFSSALTLGRAAASGFSPSIAIALCLVFAVLALAFAWLAFAHDPVD